MAGYLEVGFFADADPERQKAWWLFLFDTTRMAENLALEQVCQPYARNQPLFVGAPDLFDSIRRREIAGSPDFELIDDRAVVSIEGSARGVALGPGPDLTLPRTSRFIWHAGVAAAVAHSTYASTKAAGCWWRWSISSELHDRHVTIQESFRAFVMPVGAGSGIETHELAAIHLRALR